MADSEAELSTSKKRKVEENKDIYATFLETYATHDMTSLKKAIKNLLSDKQSSLKVCSLKEANCSRSFSFKQAYVNVEEHIDKLFPFGAVFTTGLGILIDFLKTKTAPVEVAESSLLESLLAYLLDNDAHDVLSSMGRYCKSETDVTVMIVNHLLLRITPNARCILDKGVSYNLSLICPDKCEIKLKNTTIDDTTIGNPAVWHGRIDALIGPVALTRFFDSNDDDDDDSDDDDDDCHFVLRSCVEVKKKFVEIDIPHPQVISQAIVFSFLQNQRESQQKKGLIATESHQKKSLIPTIGVSSTQLVVYFYDSKNDVLLQSAGFFFNRGADDKIRAILVAWLVVNYKHLCDGLIDQLTTVPKAKFFNVCDEKALDIYKTGLMHRGVGKGDTQTLSVYKYEQSTVEIPPATQKMLDELSCL